jgi:Ca-activated chloride channel family protein
MKINLLLDHRTILANQAQPVNFALQFRADDITTPRAKPAAFCVVLDRSGSMRGKPLEHAKEATILTIRNMRPGDNFALILFETTAQVLIPLQPCQEKQRLIDLVNNVMVAGSTNLTGGWMLGRDELKKAPGEASRLLLLLSDGLLNVGIIDQAQVRQIVATGLENDAVRTSTLGFGDNYDENLLDALASSTNGRFYDADSSEKLPAIFAEELDGLQKLAVQNLRVRLKRLDFCESFELLSGYPGVDLPDGRKEFAVGDLVSDEERVVCFGLSVFPLPWLAGSPVVSLEGEKLLELEILYDEIGDGGVVSKTNRQIVRIQATPNPQEVTVDETVVRWASMQRAGFSLKQATDQLSGGKPQQARAILEQAILVLSQSGYKGRVEEALQMLNALLSQIDAGSISTRDLKGYMMRQFYARQTSSRRPPGQGAVPPPLPPQSGSSPPSGDPGKGPSGPVA